MELEMYCKFRSLEIRNSKKGDTVYYYLTVIQNGKDIHLCVFDDKVFEVEVDKIKRAEQGTELKLVCNYNYKNNRANLYVSRVEIWKNN